MPKYASTLAPSFGGGCACYGPVLAAAAHAMRLHTCCLSATCAAQPVDGIGTVILVVAVGHAGGYMGAHSVSLQLWACKGPPISVTACWHMSRSAARPVRMHAFFRTCAVSGTWCRCASVACCNNWAARCLGWGLWWGQLHAVVTCHHTW